MTADVYDKAKQILGLSAVDLMLSFTSPGLFFNLVRCCGISDHTGYEIVSLREAAYSTRNDLALTSCSCAVLDATASRHMADDYLMCPHQLAADIISVDKRQSVS